MSDIIPLGEELPLMDDAAAPSAGAAPPGPKGKTKGRVAGRFRTINNFLDYSARALTPTESLAWVILWRDSRDGLARTSQSYLADRAGINQRTARRAIDKLCEVGLLPRVRRGGVGRGPSVYRVRPVPAEE
jgi:hypothetical protein